jgi:hypothetical protein
MARKRKGEAPKLFVRRRKSVRFLLRDNLVLEADVVLGEQQNLNGYLASRKGYVNLLNVHWVPGGGAADFYVVNVNRILWATPLDPSIPLSQVAPTAFARPVELLVEGNRVLHASLNLLVKQRLSDYFSAATGFIPLHRVRGKHDGARIGKILINPEAVEAVRDLDEEAAVLEDQATAEEVGTP